MEPNVAEDSEPGLISSPEGGGLSSALMVAVDLLAAALSDASLREPTEARMAESLGGLPKRTDRYCPLLSEGQMSQGAGRCLVAAMPKPSVTTSAFWIIRHGQGADVAATYVHDRH